MSAKIGGVSSLPFLTVWGLKGRGGASGQGLNGLNLGLIGAVMEMILMKLYKRAVSLFHP